MLNAVGFLELAPCPADARRGVDDQALRIDQARVDQRLEGKDGGRGIATGGRDCLRAADSLAVELGDAVGETAEQLGRGMGLAVPALVSRGIAEAEVGAEVDEWDFAIEDRGGDPLAVSVRQGGEDEVDAVERAILEPLDRRVREGRREVRMDLADALPRLAITEQALGEQLRVAREQPQQLTADIARGTKDRGSNHRAAYRRYCIVMQASAYSCG